MRSAPSRRQLSVARLILALAAFGCTDSHICALSDDGQLGAPVGPIRTRTGHRPALELPAGIQLEDERALLPYTRRSPPFVLRTGLPPDQHDAWLRRLRAVEQAFFDGPGAGIKDPTDADTRPWTVVIFETPAAYQTFMNEYVGFGRDAGGVFVEDRATVYTFDRPDTENSYSLRELLQHELTHALASRYIFAGTWKEPHYHREAKGWFDEGLAEMMAGLTDDPRHPFERRPIALEQLCARPPNALLELLTRHRGYDQPGTFDYATAWSFVYYLYHFRHDAFSRLVTSFRTNRFSLHSFENITRTKITDLQTAWHNAIHGWCQEAGYASESS
ncbi:MAG: collagenase [Myxococcota bacterium]